MRAGEVFRSLTGNLGTVAVGAILATLTTVSFYFITAFSPTYGSSVLHLSVGSSLTVSLCVGASNFILLPVMGALSDRIGRKPPLIGCSSVMLLIGYLALSWMTAAPSWGRLLTVELWLSAIYAGYNGALIVFLTEIMPEAIRGLCVFAGLQFGNRDFGGFTPTISTWLIHWTGNRAAPCANVSMRKSMQTILDGPVSYGSFSFSEGRRKAAELPTLRSR